MHRVRNPSGELSPVVGVPAVHHIISMSAQQSVSNCSFLFVDSRDETGPQGDRKGSSSPLLLGRLVVLTSAGRHTVAPATAHHSSVSPVGTWHSFFPLGHDTLSCHFVCFFLPMFTPLFFFALSTHSIFNRYEYPAWLKQASCCSFWDKQLILQFLLVFAYKIVHSTSVSGKVCCWNSR